MKAAAETRPRPRLTAKTRTASPSRPGSHFEQIALAQGFVRVAGIDEVGRGPLAGPVVAAAVILPGEFHHEWLDDSKKLSPERRAEVKVAIESCPGVVWAVGEATVEEIEIHNILRASLLAMRRAVDQLDPAADFLLIDGKHGLRMMPERTVVKGDATCRSIAAASILAKEYRDALMVRLAVLYPEYGFGQHRGYGTRQHLAAVERLGLCPIHRRSFFRKRLAANPALF